MSESANGLEGCRVVHQFTLDHRRQPGSRNNLRVPRTGRRHHRLGRLERSGRSYGDVTPLPLGEAGAPAGRLARRVRVSGLATFPKELTMNIEDEIINIRTTLARIEGRLSAVYTLPERVSMLEQSQAWLKGAWAVLAAVCAYIWKAIYAKKRRTDVHMMLSTH